MYLDREANHTMLKEISGAIFCSCGILRSILLLSCFQPELGTYCNNYADASAPGSVLLALSVTEAVIQNIRAKQSAGGLITLFVWGCPPDPSKVVHLHFDCAHLINLPHEHTSATCSY